MQMLQSLMLLALGLMVSTTWANEQPLTYDRIDLTVNANEEVENDTVVAILYAQREGSKAASLADEVNKTINWALTEAKAIPAIKVQTLGYYTSPLYQEQRLTGWRVRQGIQLQSQAIAKLMELIGTLQARLTLESINYRVSDEKRKAAEGKLISEAITSFKQRAQLITQQLGRSEYRLVHMSVNTEGGTPQPQPRMAMARAMEAAVSPPALALGTQTVSVNISGTVELQVK